MLSRPLGNPLGNPLALPSGGGSDTGVAGRPKLTLIYSTRQPVFSLPEGYKFVRFTLVASGGAGSSGSSSSRGGGGGGGGGTARSFKLPITSQVFTARLLYENNNTPFQLVYEGMTMAAYGGGTSLGAAGSFGTGGTATITVGYGEVFPGTNGQPGGDGGANRIGFAGGNGGTTALPELPFGGGAGGGAAANNQTDPSLGASGKSGPGALPPTEPTTAIAGVSSDIIMNSTRFGSLACLRVELW